VEPPLLWLLCFLKNGEEGGGRITFLFFVFEESSFFTMERDVGMCVCVNVCVGSVKEQQNK
jgi:hypothetical protein